MKKTLFLFLLAIVTLCSTAQTNRFRDSTVFFNSVNFATPGKSIYYKNGAVPGYVLTATDTFGKAAWQTATQGNIYTLSAAIDSDRTVTLDTNYLAIGNPSSDDSYFAIGDLTPFGLKNSFISAQAENIELYCPIIPDQGLFFALKNVNTEELEAVFVMQKRIIGETVGAISVYAEDGLLQRARVAVTYDSATTNAKARLCAYSDSISEQNYAQVKNNGIDISYRQTTTGDRYEIVINDTSISIKLNNTVFFQMDTAGNILSPSIFDRDFASDAAAGAGGVPVKGLYHNSGVLHIREN